MTESYRPSDSDFDFVHTGPGTLAGRFMRGFWQPVALSRDLPPGRARPIRIMSEDMTLYRGEATPSPGPSPARGEGQQAHPSPAAGVAEGRRPTPSPSTGEGWGEGGKVHLLAFRCAHRGTQLSTGWVEGDDLRCFYHGWKYDGSGQCVEQPAEPEPFCQRIKIRSYPVQEYLGMVFAYLGEGEAPRLPRYPEFEEPGVLDVTCLYRACNYFNTIENEVDSVHVSFAHRKSRPGVANQPPPLVDGEEMEWGIRQRYTYATPAGEVVKISYLGMPNIKYGQMPPQTDFETGAGDDIRWMVPVDDERHIYFVAHLSHVAPDKVEAFHEARVDRSKLDPYTADVAAKILAGERRIQDVTEEADGIPIVQTQDDVAQAGQGAIANRDEERLGRSDTLILLLRKIWIRELRALAEGTPGKEWTLPETLRPSRPIIAPEDPRILVGSANA